MLRQLGVVERRRTWGEAEGGRRSIKYTPPRRTRLDARVGRERRVWLR